MGTARSTLEKSIAVNSRSYFKNLSVKRKLKVNNSLSSNKQLNIYMCCQFE